MAGSTRSRFARSLADYAALVRVPNLFTAPPDVLLGVALAAGAGASVATPGVVGLAVASVLLYAAGTTLNDAFDAPADATERPERPIPSGRVSRRAGFGFGALLLLGGVATATLAAGATGGVVAAGIAVAILLYDGVLKGGLAGFATMGAIRGLNVLLGATAAGLSPAELPGGAIAVALAVTAYVSGVTYMAANETERGNRHAVAVAGLGALVAGAFLGLRLLGARPGAVPTLVTLGLAVGFLGWVGRALWNAFREPVPGTIGPAVGTCVLALVLLDAAFAAPTSLGLAAVILSFLVPAIGLNRFFSVT